MLLSPNLNTLIRAISMSFIAIYLLFGLAQDFGGVVVSLWSDRLPPGMAAVERSG
ncbi:hypothetical protein [Nitrincola sp. A-D6]|uniref:hypothetical protein n=1 Tax=Nitrincola sp. A-D6 TaxID=1545442 RepID=UPI001363AA55|nr:hypothetical protein [Nitrincola sp. A-D6]